MAAAVLTPRVWNMVVCDEAIASATEVEVFTLEGVRQHLDARIFPCLAQLNLFLLLSSTRKGTYQGKVLVINDNDLEEPRAISYVKFSARFQYDNELLPLYIEMQECKFPEPGRYTFQVWFWSAKGQEALKGERPFHVLENEE